MYRKGPFFTMNHDETPRSKMLKVKSRTGGIFRPYLGPIEAENICMNELELKVMEMCWNEDPNERPESFSHIKKILIQIHESRRSKKNVSIIDTFPSQVFAFVRLNPI